MRSLAAAAAFCAATAEAAEGIGESDARYRNSNCAHWRLSMDTPVTGASDAAEAAAVAEAAPGSPRAAGEAGDIVEATCCTTALATPTAGPGGMRRWGKFAAASSAAEEGEAAMWNEAGSGTDWCAGPWGAKVSIAAALCGEGCTSPPAAAGPLFATSLSRRGEVTSCGGSSGMRTSSNALPRGEGLWPGRERGNPQTGKAAEGVVTTAAAGMIGGEVSGCSMFPLDNGFEVAVVGVFAYADAGSGARYACAAEGCGDAGAASPPEAAAASM